MSTYYGYVCKSHTPNLASEHWFNHGEELLAEAYKHERAGTWPNDVTGDPESVAYGMAAPIYWLRDHPNCIIAIRNEYGEETPLEPEPCTDCRKCIGETALKTAHETGNWWNALPVRMVVCPGCGNKRCPKASYHENACTGSNAPDQPGAADHVTTEDTWNWDPPGHGESRDPDEGRGSTSPLRDHHLNPGVPQPPPT